MLVGSDSNAHPPFSSPTTHAHLPDRLHSRKHLHRRPESTLVLCTANTQVKREKGYDIPAVSTSWTRSPPRRTASRWRMLCAFWRSPLRQSFTTFAAIARDRVQIRSASSDNQSIERQPDATRRAFAVCHCTRLRWFGGMTAGLLRLYPNHVTCLASPTEPD